MKTKISKTILSGLSGTAMMIILMMIAPIMGIPTMSPPIMLSSMLGIPAWLG